MHKSTKKSDIEILTCVRCGMHETSELINFDEFGICKACRSSEQKMHINWSERQKKLRKIFEHFKKNSNNNYDCIVPISGGKDSAFQLYLLTQVYKIKPLAVTFSHNWFSEVGRKNLKNVTERLGVDLIEFTPNRKLINSLAKKSLNLIGDSCWHCHTGVDSFPLHVSVKFNIPLIVYGESVAEHSGKATYLDQPDYSIDYFLKFSSIVKVKEMLGDTIKKKDLNLFEWPDQKDLERVNTTRIHLADFIFWDAERQVEFLKESLGWLEDHVEGTYKKYKSVECIMPGVHDYTKFLKRGFGRGTDFASQDVRAGLLTLQDAKKISKEYDPVRPKILDYYLKITGYKESEFEGIIKKHRKNKALKFLHPSELKKENKFKSQEISNSVHNYIKDYDEKFNWTKKIENINNEILFPNFGIGTKKFSSSNLNKEYNLIEKPELLTLKQKLDFIKQKKLSVYEICKSHINLINKFDKDIKAFIEFDEEKAFYKANLIDEELSKNNFKENKLIGCVVGMKDIFNTSDFKTQMGSEAWKNFNPGNDARAVFELRKESALIIGKTATAEFGIDHPPKTRNPYNVNYLVGTSSSGSAASVAARMVSVALGTQTAASTIRPSSYCGIFGFKPTFGSIARTGVLKTCDQLDHITLMANSIDDIRTIFDVVRVKGKNYPLISKFIENDQNYFDNIKKAKVAFVKTHTWKFASQHVKNSITNYISDLQKKGINVREVELPDAFSEAHEIQDVVFSKSVSYYFNDEYKNKKNSLQEKTLERIEKGKSISMNEFLENIDKQDFLENELSNFFSNYDFIITHSTASTAPKDESNIENPDPSLIWALTRVPSLNIPQFMNNKLPFGFQIISKKYNDYKLLEFCNYLKKLNLIPCQSKVPF